MVLIHVLSGLLSLFCYCLALVLFGKRTTHVVFGILFVIGITLATTSAMASSYSKFGLLFFPISVQTLIAVYFGLIYRFFLRGVILYTALTLASFICFILCSTPTFIADDHSNLSTQLTFFFINILLGLLFRFHAQGRLLMHSTLMSQAFISAVTAFFISTIAPLIQLTEWWWAITFHLLLQITIVTYCFKIVSNKYLRAETN